MATSTYPSQTPQCAAVVADASARAGRRRSTSPRLCGFCYALSIASDMVRLGTEDYVLVIGVERMSDSTEPTDRSVRFIFGDAPAPSSSARAMSPASVRSCGGRDG